MSVKEMDEILSRWFCDGAFREQLRHDPEHVLDDYDLTAIERARWLRLNKPAAMEDAAARVSTAERNPPANE